MPLFRKPLFIKGSPDTATHILRIAESQGWFTVSLRYRDEWLQRICDKLVKEGHLTKDRKIQKGQYIYYPVEHDKT